MNKANLDIAVDLLEAGFHIFPLGGYGEEPPQTFVVSHCKGDMEVALKAWPKRPRISWKAYQDVSPTLEMVEQWWTKWPTANIGLACGKIIVVDADSRDSEEWVKNNLTPTPVRVTTNKGAHFYFRANPLVDAHNSVNALAKIDVRGPGGYVVGPGSTHSSGAVYELVLAEGASLSISELPMIQPDDLTRIAGYRDHNIAAGGGNLGLFNAAEHRSMMDGGPVEVGSRNSTAASMAGRYFASGLSVRETKMMLDSWNMSNPTPLADEELNTVIASVAQTVNSRNPAKPVPLVPAPPRSSGRAKQYEPFPPHLLEVPGLIGDMMHYMIRTSLKPQPELALAASVAACGALMGQKVCSRYTNVRTNVYMVGIAPSGAGKEHARKCVKLIFKEAGAEKYLGAEDLGSVQGLFASLAISPSNVMQIDEFGRVCKACNNERSPAYLQAIATLMTKLTGCADSSYKEPLKGTHMSEAPITLEQPCLCLYATTVPGSLFDSLSAGDIDGGFLPRILQVHVTDPDPEWQVVTDRSVPQHIIEQVRAWVTRPTNAYPKGNIQAIEVIDPLAVETTPEAEQVLMAFRLTNKARKAACRVGSGLDSMWARADEHAIRLALIRACGMDFENPIIQESDAEWGCQFALHSISRAIAEIEVRVAGNEQESWSRKVEEFIASKGKCTMRDVLRKFRTLRSTQLREIITLLVEIEVIERHIVENKGARPSEELRWTGGPHAVPEAANDAVTF